MEKNYHSLGENFTGTKPEAIEFMGEYFEVTSAVSILMTILEYLISKDIKKIESMVADNYLKGFLCSEENASVRRPKRLSNGMLVESNNNARDFYKAISKVLSYFNIDEVNLKIFLKNDKNDIKEEDNKNKTVKGIVINSFKFKNC